MSFQYTANLNMGKKYANICRIADKRAYFMSIQLFTSSVLTWLGKSIVWTARQNTNREETTGIWSRLRTEQIAFFSAEDKGSLSGHACHCMGGGQLLRREIHACILGHQCATAHARTASALSDGRQVPENLQSPKRAAHVDKVWTHNLDIFKHSEPQAPCACDFCFSYGPWTYHPRDDTFPASLARGQPCSSGSSLSCSTRTITLADVPHLVIIVMSELSLKF